MNSITTIYYEMAVIEFIQRIHCLSISKYLTNQKLWIDFRATQHVKNINVDIFNIGLTKPISLLLLRKIDKFIFQ